MEMKHIKEFKLNEEELSFDEEKIKKELLELFPPKMILMIGV